MNDDTAWAIGIWMQTNKFTVPNIGFGVLEKEINLSQPLDQKIQGCLLPGAAGEINKWPREARTLLEAWDFWFPFFDLRLFLLLFYFILSFFVKKKKKKSPSSYYRPPACLARAILVTFPGCRNKEVGKKSRKPPFQGADLPEKGRRLSVCLQRTSSQPSAFLNSSAPTPSALKSNM